MFMIYFLKPFMKYENSENRFSEFSLSWKTFLLNLFSCLINSFIINDVFTNLKENVNIFNFFNIKYEKPLYVCFFNRNLYHGCLVYMFSLRFSGRIFLINLRRQFRVRKFFRVGKIFCAQDFAGFAVFSFCVWNYVLFQKCVTYVAGCSLIKTCSLTGC